MWDSGRAASSIIRDVCQNVGSAYTLSQKTDVDIEANKGFFFPVLFLSGRREAFFDRWGIESPIDS